MWTGAKSLGTRARSLRTGARSLAMGSLAVGARSLAMGAKSLVTNTWGLAQTRGAPATNAVGQLSQRGIGRIRTFRGMAGESRTAGHWALGTAPGLRGLGWVGSLTLLGVIPGTGRAWRAQALRRQPLWSVTSPGAARRAVGIRLVNTAVPQDVLLFHHQRVTFFRLLGLFCTAQFLFWIYLAHFAFTSLKDTGHEETVLVGDRASSLPKIGGISLNLGSSKWRYGFTTSCLTVGSLILAAGYIFARRSVHRVLLHRGGQQVTLSTYLPFGGTSSFRVPLRDLSCMAHRTEVPSVIPVKAPITGCWRNDVNSFMNILVERPGQISGRFRSLLSDGSASAEGTITGFYQESEWPTFGIVVKWAIPENIGSITVWTGQYFNFDHSETLQTMWLLRSSAIGTVYNNWNTTRVGTNVFVRHVGDCEIVLPSNTRWEL
ncbi:transmembrane protein 223 [Heptranchias perlo]|uniref:transmembrane protein 223 n=1 Tax=Heptranchias perlo TaxID=212740 RepID=UPI00355A8232